MKNYIIGFCFLAGAFILIWKQSEEQMERAKESGASSPLKGDSNYTFVANDTNKSVAKSNLGVVGGINKIMLGEPTEEETLTQGLSNDFSFLTFTNYLGGIRSVDLKKHGRLSKPYEMVQPGEPLLGISFHKMINTYFKGIN